MNKKIKTSVIKDTIWISDSQASQINYDLMDGIPEGIERYIKAVEEVLPLLLVEDGVVRLEDIWLETSLPLDLLRDIIKKSPLKWPANIERISLDANEYVVRPATDTEEEMQG